MQYDHLTAGRFRHGTKLLRWSKGDGVPWKFDPANLARLESPERLVLLPVDRVIGLAQVQPGEKILDIGCGTGVFTVPLARATGESGRVIAADIRAEMVAACRARIETIGLPHVDVLVSGENAIPLPAASVDLVFACQILHELHEPEVFLKDVRRVLAPGGRLAAFEWEKIETGIGPPLEHRVSPEEVLPWFEASGLTVTRGESVSWANYYLLARPA